MATTFVDYTGDGNATKAFSFPSIQESDVKVEVDGVIKTSGSHYNITSYTTTGGGNVVFTSGNIPSSPAAIRIFRDTDVDAAKATYTAGSSVKAADLNANHEQLLFAAQEEQNQTIQTSKIKDAAVTSAKIKDGTIVNADINASAAIDGSKINPAFGSQNITTSGTVDGRDVSADGTKLDGIEAGATADQTNAEIRAAVEAASDSNVFTDADHSKLNAIEASATADQTASEIKALIATSPLDSSHLASNSVTTSQIADAELTTLAGMPSGTASKLADSTTLTSDIADLNQIDGMQKATTVTDDDTKFPTSGAIVDYVAAQLEPFGGFEAIANEVSFPNTQPPAGVAISIADAAGIVVNGSGTSTTGRTVGGTTVTINNINSQYNSSTVASGIRFIVTSTGSGQVYNYHKSTLPESDLVNLSGDINDFNERYRVGGSNPTTSLDAGDLFFNTGTNKLLVYNATNSAWEETQTVGNFFINTISSSSSTGGGSATPNGTAYRFTLSNAGTFAQQHIVSVDGVIQKPNSGTSQPSEGFAVDGGDIIFGSAPVNGASLFVITIGASVSIGTPSNNTVTSAILQNGSVTTAKIADANVTTAKIADANVTTAKIADAQITNTKLATDSVTETKIQDTSITAPKILNGAVGGIKLAVDSVSTAKIINSNVTTEKIADDAVTADKLANTSVTAGSYGSATAIPAITVDAQGRITAASTNSISAGVTSDAQTNTVAGTEAGDSFTGTDANGNSLFGYQAGTAITTGDYNVFIGRHAGKATTTSSQNTAVGVAALDANTTGGVNTAIGANALGSNTTAYYNTAVGQQALAANTTASDNTAVGYLCFAANTTGTSNTGIGNNAADANTTGSGITAIGRNACGANTTASNNTAVGRSALVANDTGEKNTCIGAYAGNAGNTVHFNENVAVGYGALGDVIDSSDHTVVGFEAQQTDCGSENTVFGFKAAKYNHSIRLLAIGPFAGLNNNTWPNTFIGYNSGGSSSDITGAQSTAIGNYTLSKLTSGNSNTAIGHDAGKEITTGQYNTACGAYSLDSNSTASYDTGFGYGTLSSITSGWGDTAMGYHAGANITSAWGCTVIGNDAGKQITTGQDNTCVGHNSGSSINTGTTNTLVGVSTGDVLTTGSNNVCIGFDVDPTSSTVSNTITLGNNAISTLRCNQTSISSLSDERDKTEIIDLPIGLDFINKVRPVKFKWASRDGKQGKDGTYDAGFIAQEFQAVESSTSVDYLNLVVDDNPDKLEATPNQLFPVLVKAVQELSAKVAALEAA